MRRHQMAEYIYKLLMSCVRSNAAVVAAVTVHPKTIEFIIGFDSADTLNIVDVHNQTSLAALRNGNDIMIEKREITITFPDGQEIAATSLHEDGFTRVELLTLVMKHFAKYKTQNSITILHSMTYNPTTDNCTLSVDYC